MEYKDYMNQYENKFTSKLNSLKQENKLLKSDQHGY